MKHILILSVVLFLLAGCAGPTTGSGHLVSRSFDLEGFSRIDANSAVQAEVTRGDGFRVDVEVDDNLVDLLSVAVRGDTLYIKLENGVYKKVNLRARVTMPELAGVKLNGGSTLETELAGQDVELDLNGASSVTLSGAAGRVTLGLNGASTAMLTNLAAGDVSLDVNGASQAEVRASGDVRGLVNGASTVTVTGAPALVDVKADGSSRVITK